MDGGRYIAKQRGIIRSKNSRAEIRHLIAEKPWLLMTTLSKMSEHDRKELKWIIAKI